MGKKRLTYEEVKRFIEIESGSGCLLLSEEYVRVKDPLNLKCNCGALFSTTFAMFKYLNKRQCNKCGLSNADKKLSHDEFVNRVLKDELGKYEVLDKYTNAIAKVTMKHNECGNIYKVAPIKFLTGSRCPNCFGNIRKSTEEFKAEVYNLEESNYEVLGEYINAKTKLKMKHAICGYIYETTPDNFLGGRRCTKCNGKMKKNTEYFKGEVYELVGCTYDVTGDYVNTSTKIQMRHNECGHIFDVTPINFLRGSRCPNCAFSKSEQIISGFLEDVRVKFDNEYRIPECKNKFPLRFDFKLNNSNGILLIEYDGEQHFKPVDFTGKGFDYAKCSLKIAQDNDNIKNQYCIDNGIPLIRIPYWEKNNLEYILENVLSYFNIHKLNNKIDTELIQRYLVNSHWNHDTYLSWQHKENRCWLNN